MPDNLKVPSKFSSLMACKCPRCRTGRVFPKSIFDITGFSKTNDFCPHCGLKFEHETGFFWGAMYISYAFSTAFMIFFGVVAINNDWAWNKILWTILLTAVVLVPFSYRYSRILLLYGISPHRHFKVRYRLGELKDTGL
ncbi:MAG: DUF983 domain-containing protein [Bacteroidia bacterium]|nr:DUF983 domain-containing protein [Bacteroidia bacterium]